MWPPHRRLTALAIVTLVGMTMGCVVMTALHVILESSALAHALPRDSIFYAVLQVLRNPLVDALVVWSMVGTGGYAGVKFARFLWVFWIRWRNPPYSRG